MNAWQWYKQGMIYCKQVAKERIVQQRKKVVAKSWSPLKQTTAPARPLSFPEKIKPDRRRLLLHGYRINFMRWWTKKICLLSFLTPFFKVVFDISTSLSILISIFFKLNFLKRYWYFLKLSIYQLLICLINIYRTPFLTMSEFGCRCHRLNNLACLQSLHMCRWRSVVLLAQFGKLSKFMELSSYVRNKLKLDINVGAIIEYFSKFCRLLAAACQSFLITGLLGASQIITALVRLEKIPAPITIPAAIIVGILQ